jgi:hypothetical protein
MFFSYFWQFGAKKTILSRQSQRDRRVGWVRVDVKCQFAICFDEKTDYFEA